MPTQLPLIPLKVRYTKPANLGSADLKTLAVTFDRQDYAAKTLSDHRWLPATEWIGYKLSEACQLAVPYHHPLEMPDGTMAFGSRWEFGVKEWNYMPIADRQMIIQDAGEAMSSILALDLFYGNDDRHPGNFLYRQNNAGQWTALAFDFSRAGLLAGFPPGATLPLPANSNTSTTVQMLQHFGAWNTQAAAVTIASLQAITVDQFNGMLHQAQRSWLDQPMFDALSDFWASPAKNARINSILGLI